MLLIRTLLDFNQLTPDLLELNWTLCGQTYTRTGARLTGLVKTESGQVGHKAAELIELVPIVFGWQRLAWLCWTGVDGIELQ